MKKILKARRLPILLLLLVWANAAGAQDFKLRGRVFLDAFYGISHAQEFSNGFNNRTARIGATGKLSEHWDGLIELDFAEQVISAKDIRMRRSLGTRGRLWIGQFKVPQGFNELTSSSEILFLERSVSNNSFVPGRRLGIAGEYRGEGAGVTAMVFGRAIGQKNTLEDDMPLGTALRGYVSPSVGKGILHLGASATWENFPDTATLRFSDRPEVRDSKGGNVRMVSADVENTSSVIKTGLELLWLSGPFSLEGEWMRVWVNRYVPAHAAFYGYHVQAGYVINGSRSYSGGVITGVQQSGAWELAMRYSNVNLNNNGFLGGEQTNLTAGVNYYATSKIRFMLNVIMASSDRQQQSPVMGAVRAQYSF
jgi:phosphate-selective porin OprO and OprP